MANRQSCIIMSTGTEMHCGATRAVYSEPRITGLALVKHKIELNEVCPHCLNAYCDSLDGQISTLSKRLEYIHG